jgi:hypothetical protein
MAYSHKKFQIAYHEWRANLHYWKKKKIKLKKKIEKLKKKRERERKTSYNVFSYLKQCHLVLKLCCLCCPIICYSLDKEAIAVIQSI